MYNGNTGYNDKLTDDFVSKYGMSVYKADPANLTATTTEAVYETLRHGKASAPGFDSWEASEM